MPEKSYSLGHLNQAKNEDLLEKCLIEKMHYCKNNFQSSPAIPKYLSYPDAEPSDSLVPSVHWKEKMVNVPGYDSTETVFTKKDLKGQVFAVKLLTQPIKLYTKDGKKLSKLTGAMLLTLFITIPLKPCSVNHALKI